MPIMVAQVILFKPSGKYYTEEEWTVPDDALVPYDMRESPDFRRIDGGAVLIVTQEPWGYPHLFPSHIGPLSPAIVRIEEIVRQYRRDEL